MSQLGHGALFPQAQADLRHSSFPESHTGNLFTSPGFGQPPHFIDEEAGVERGQMSFPVQVGTENSGFLFSKLLRNVWSLGAPMGHRDGLSEAARCPPGSAGEKGRGR